jgi:hypothetical protein
MQLAVLGDERIEPTRTGQRAVCPGCGEEVLSKCGEILAWHWAHIGGADCVASEGMTQWHKDWQDLTPKTWQEIIGRDIDGAVVHRADIRLPSGLIVEIQRSPISVADIESREDYWRRVAWIRHGEGLKISIAGQRPSKIQPHTWPSLKAKIAKRKQDLREKKRIIERISSLPIPVSASEAKSKLLSLNNFLLQELRELAKAEDSPAMNVSVRFEAQGKPIELGLSSFAWRVRRPSWDAHNAPVWIDIPDSEYMALINLPKFSESCFLAHRSTVQALLKSGIDISAPQAERIDIEPRLFKLKQEIRKKISKQLQSVAAGINLIEEKQEREGEMLIAEWKAGQAERQAQYQKELLEQDRKEKEASMGRVLQLGGLSPRFVHRWIQFFESCQDWRQIEEATRQIEEGVKLLLWRQLSPELKQRLRQLKTQGAA